MSFIKSHGEKSVLDREFGETGIFDLVAEHVDLISSDNTSLFIIYAALVDSELVEFAQALKFDFQSCA